MLIDEDISYLSEKMMPFKDRLMGVSILITGGTGFFGKWLLQSISLLNKIYMTEIKVYVVARNSKQFVDNFPEFVSSNIVFINENVVHLSSIPKVDYVIHAATSVGIDRNLDNHLKTFETVVLGTKNILELVKDQKLKGFLLVSSGAVYGTQSQDMDKIPEAFCGGPDFLNSKSIYGESKRVAETLGSIYKDIYGLPVKVARCFAFIGPYLSGGGAFAAESFIADVSSGRDIKVSGDGNALRGYLYAADLAVWLWTILLNGRVGEAYNVGNDEPVSMKDFANKVTQVYTRDFFSGSFSPKVDIVGKEIPGARPSRYLPDVARARNELGLKCNIGLEEAIRRTLKFHLS
jgi:dTDP-glucose 4,6-dehydratase